MSDHISQSDSPDQANNKVWIEDGVLNAKIIGELNIEIIMYIQGQILELMTTQKIKLIPVVVDVTSVADSSMKLHVSELGKIFMESRDIFMHESGVWIVGAKGKLLKLGTLASHTFMSGRLKFADSLSEAQTAALTSINTSSAILEPDE